MKKVMILGSGEIGKELTKSFRDKQSHVCCVDRYNSAPAFDYANERISIDMNNYDKLCNLIKEVKPDYIVPEIEAINIDALCDLEKEGVNIVPSASAIKYTMDRRNIRDLSISLGFLTAKSFYTDNFCDFVSIIDNNFKNQKIVIKPLMSSSGKGQSIINPDTNKDILREFFFNAINNSRGSSSEIIIEEFIDFDFEITILYYRSKYGSNILNPIIHKQEDGDFKESSQVEMSSLFNEDTVNYLRDLCDTIVNEINKESNKPGYGLYGIEFFVKGNDIYFSELSPRPHDTGFITKKTMTYSEFDIHTRCILGYNIQDNNFIKSSSCITINFPKVGDYKPFLTDESLLFLGDEKIDFELFGKKEGYPGRRLGIIYGDNLSNLRDIKSMITFEPLL